MKIVFVVVQDNLLFLFCHFLLQFFFDNFRSVLKPLSLSFASALEKLNSLLELLDPPEHKVP